MLLVVQTQNQQGKERIFNCKVVRQILLADTMNMHHLSHETSQLQLKLPSSTMLFHLKEVGLPVTGSNLECKLSM